MMKTFYQLMGNVLLVGVTQSFVWFAVIYWVYLQTSSVLATSIMTGSYMIFTAVSGFWFGSIVDHNKKKKVMMISGIITFVLFGISFLVYVFSPKEAFTTIASAPLWLFVITVLLGVIAGNLRGLALPPLITMLVPEENRDKANGMYGTINGIIFSIVNIASGFTLAFAGMFWVLLSSLILSVIGLFHLLIISIPEKDIAIAEGEEKRDTLDISGTIALLKGIPGLIGLMFFNTFNNLLMGIFMPLMDPYGLSLVSLQVWSVLWAVLSFSFIFGGMIVARRGVGKNPVRTLFLGNIVLWIVSMFFTIQPSILLVIIGMFIWLSLMPLIEAAEHTILQKVVPVERQGRVFGFAQSIENIASPFTAFFIGPLTEFFFIPLMTTGFGASLIGSWYGTGPARGIALVFSVAGFVGLILTLAMMRTKSYSGLSKRYLQDK
ncbi:MAG: MFS transporter [Candidatus Dojkabacteria bacterium]|nr:MAG: MFS transporter [Candidatus Dojkabacteria bacterium]